MRQHKRSIATWICGPVVGVFIGSMSLTASALADPTFESNIRPIGYYLPNGVYVRTWHCWRVIVGYTWNGYPIFNRMCGYR